MEIDFCRVELVEALDNLDKWTAPQKVGNNSIDIIYQLIIIFEKKKKTVVK